ncbi:hypothetical protein E4T56_gene13353 [Termitomyces sp. T112]|nr:hypothetical protein E4T56_gene13353 [Termitomyces sp. T112]
MGKSAKLHKRVKKTKSSGGSIAPALSACTPQAQVQVAKKKANLRGKTAKNNTGSSGEGLLGGADYVVPDSLSRTSYAPCLRHGPVALASSQTQPHFVRLGPRYSTQCFIPDPTSLRLVRSLYFKLNAKSQTQPHFIRLGPCISNSMPSPRPNLTSFG